MNACQRSVDDTSSYNCTIGAHLFSFSSCEFFEKAGEFGAMCKFFRIEHTPSACLGCIDISYDCKNPDAQLCAKIEEV